MAIWFIIYGLYYREEPVTLSDIIKAFFICLIPTAPFIGAVMLLAYWLEDNGETIVFRPKKAIVKEMEERMTASGKSRNYVRMGRDPV